jgi:hypothetical protein
MPDNDRAVGGELHVAPRMVPVQMRVDEITDWQRSERRDGRLKLVVHRRELAIHHNQAVLANRDGDIAAETLQHVGVMAEIECLHDDLGKIRSDRRCGLLLGDCWSRKADDGSGQQAGAEFCHCISLSNEAGYSAEERTPHPENQSN